MADMNSDFLASKVEVVAPGMFMLIGDASTVDDDIGDIGLKKERKSATIITL